MKTIKALLILTAAFLIASCNNNSRSKGSHDMSEMNDSAKTMADADKPVLELNPSFGSLDPKLAQSIKTVVDDYLHVKNALAADNGNEAAGGAKEMEAAMNKIDKSLFTAEQKKLYDANEDNLKEHAESINKSSSNIEQQREHFSAMSENVYALVKAFGGGQTLYHDHCPMYKDKGAMWVSETKEIKNPYMGNKMATCGEIIEKIK